MTFSTYDLNTLIHILEKQGIELAAQKTVAELKQTHPRYIAIMESFIETTEGRCINDNDIIPITTNCMPHIDAIEVAETRAQLEFEVECIMYHSRELALTFMIGSGFLPEHKSEEFRSLFSWGLEQSIRPVLTKTIHKLIK